MNKEIVKRIRIIEIKGRHLPDAQEWSEQEMNFLGTLYDKYKNKEPGKNAAWLRAMFKNRSLAAISKKYWSLYGSTKRAVEPINQIKMDFVQEKVTYDPNR